MTEGPEGEKLPTEEEQRRSERSGRQSQLFRRAVTMSRGSFLRPDLDTEVTD